MSVLKIRLDIKIAAGGPKEFSVVARVTPLSSKERAARFSPQELKDLQNLLIPAGPAGGPTDEFLPVALPPGKYFVEAILPSEETVGEEVLVSDSPLPHELRLSSKEPPQEPDGWKAPFGVLSSSQAGLPDGSEFWSAPGGVLNSPFPGVPAGLSSFVLRLASPAPEQTGLLDPAAAWLSQGYFFMNKPFLDSLRSNPPGAFGGWSGLNPPGQVSPGLIADSVEPAYEIHEFNRARLSSLLGPERLPARPRQSRAERTYLFVHGEGFPDQFSVLPAPWKLANANTEASIEARILRAATAPSGADGLDQGFRIALTVQDKIFGAMIGYLGVGRLPAAETIARQATGLLFEKYDNPLAAAAGAYVLLGNPASERPVYIQDWMRNLMVRFAWLPDGAILYGRLLMEQTRDQAGLKEAYACFLEGFRRGLPFFSRGVGYLLDGLTRFANDGRRSSQPDQEVEAALALVRELSLRTNVRQPFTSILLD